MLQSIPEEMQKRMDFLVATDTKDRKDGTPRERRLRQIPATTGSFIALLAATAPEGEWIEIGSSGGYSALWLALAAREMGKRVTTYENDPGKIKIAKETFAEAGVEDVVTLVEGDALDHLKDVEDIAFCFLDAEKEIYSDCYELVVPKLVYGGLLVADNAISHADELHEIIDRAYTDGRVHAVVKPLDRGELVCRKLGE